MKMIPESSEDVRPSHAAFTRAPVYALARVSPRAHHVRVWEDGGRRPAAAVPDPVVFPHSAERDRGGLMFYHHLLVTKPAPPPDPVRGRDVDWAQLTLEEQGCVLGYQRAELDRKSTRLNSSHS